VFQTGFWGEYLDVRGRRWREAGEDCIMRSFIVLKLHRTEVGWKQGGWGGGACRRHGRDVKCIQNFSWKSEATRPYGRSKRRWEDNNRMNLREVRWEGGCILLRIRASGGLLWTRYWTFGLLDNFFTSWVTVSFSRGTLLYGVSWLVGSLVS
jgi:hypothetical protein